MRLMSHCRLRKKTGIYEFRRVVPAHLRDHLPDVPGFPTKPGRTEFTKSLETRNIAEANRRTAELDKYVASALVEAERRHSGSTALTAAVAPADSAAHPVIAEMIDPKKAVEAIDRWHIRQLREAKLRAFNGIRHETGFPEPADDPHWLMGRLKYDRQARWKQIDCFEAALIQALASEDIRARPGQPALKHLRPHFADRWLYVLEKASQMSAGVFDWDEDSEDDSISDRAQPRAADQPPPAQSPSAAISLDRLLESYLGSGDVAPKTLTTIKAIIRDLKQVIANPDDVASITSAEIRRFRDFCEQRPARLRKQDQGSDLMELVRRYAKTDVKKLDRNTVSKYLELLGAVFQHGWRVEAIKENPVSRAKFTSKSKRAVERSRTSFTRAELETIFSSPMFTGCKNARSRQTPGGQIIKDTRYWVMLLAFYTGARLNEIGQAHVGDVLHDEVDKIDYLRISLLRDDPTAAQKGLKTANSERRVPLHPALIKAGFFEYVQKQRHAGARYLFPDLPHGGIKAPTTALSKALNRYLDHIGITAKSKVLHSFRHSFKELCHNARLPKVVSDRLSGHESSDVGDGYGEGPELVVLHRALLELRFHKISWLEA